VPLSSSGGVRHWERDWALKKRREDGDDWLNRDGEEPLGDISPTFLSTAGFSHRGGGGGTALRETEDGGKGEKPSGSHISLKGER